VESERIVFILNLTLLNFLILAPQPKSPARYQLRNPWVYTCLKRCYQESARLVEKTEEISSLNGRGADSGKEGEWEAKRLSRGLLTVSVLCTRADSKGDNPSTRRNQRRTGILAFVGLFASPRSYPLSIYLSCRYPAAASRVLLSIDRLSLWPFESSLSSQTLRQVPNNSSASLAPPSASIAYRIISRDNSELACLVKREAESGFSVSTTESCRLACGARPRSQLILKPTVSKHEATAHMKGRGSRSTIRKDGSSFAPLFKSARRNPLPGLDSRQIRDG